MELAGKPAVRVIYVVGWLQRLNRLDVALRTVRGNNEA
jgi:hypothetical protein